GLEQSKGDRMYRCTSRCAPTKIIQEIGCTQGLISCHLVDAAVWNVVSSALLDPSILIDALDREFTSEKNEQLTTQLQFIEQEIRDCETEDNKLYKAYTAGAFDEIEYAERRQPIKARILKLKEHLATVRRQVISPEQLDEQKRHIL